MVAVAGAPVVAVLTRAPGHGGKSRLFDELHVAPDPALRLALLLDTLDGTAIAGAARVVAVEPPEACDEVRALLPPGVEVMPQAGGSLGDRMRDAMATLFERGARSVVLVGSDLPDIDGRQVSRALALLERDPELLVLGPATDGGYYLIGAARTPPPVFDGIPWGTKDALAATIGAAHDRRVGVAFVEPMDDVDTAADLKRVKARRTRDWVRAHLGQE